MHATKSVLAAGAMLLFPGALPAVAQSPLLGISRDPAGIRLSLVPPAGRVVALETAPVADAATWTRQILAGSTNNTVPWLDAGAPATAARFYRLRDIDPGTAGGVAANFRLLDHTGRSHELNYHLSNPAVTAVVLVFTGLGCSQAADTAPTVKVLRDQFAPQGVLFWMIDSNDGDTRATVAAQATALGLDLPVLLDPAQGVARAYGAQTTPACFALRKGNFEWEVFYSGAIDDRTGTMPSSTTQAHLATALTTHLAGGRPDIRWARPAGCDISLRPPAPITYSGTIAPLLIQKCVRCHSPGNIAPWSMTSHAIVQSYASSIHSALLTGEMPPWHADPHYAALTNDLSLSPTQMDALLQWVREGAPRGSGLDPLESATGGSTQYPVVWPPALGTPDAILSIPTQSLPASGEVAYRYFNVTNPFPNDVWLRASVVLPGNLRVVHHSLVLEAGGLSGLDGFFAGYVPGYEAVEYPAGTGKLLRRGQVLRFQMHYITTGSAETDRTQLGLYLAPAPPARTLLTKSAFNLGFVLGSPSIPAGAPDFEITGQYPAPTFGNPSPALTRDILIYEVSPHMHLRGSRFRYEVVRPDGSREVILSVPHYEFHWQALYRFVQPVRVTAGSRIECVGAWDNSAQNPHNPAPNLDVSWGDQTDDEMFIGYFNFVELP